MNPDYWILDEEQYEVLVDRYTSRLHAYLIARFRAGAKKKGPTVDLSARNFAEERWEEQVDEVAYTLMEDERVRRAKAIL